MACIGIVVTDLIKGGHITCGDLTNRMNTKAEEMGWVGRRALKEDQLYSRDRTQERLFPDNQAGQSFVPPFQ
jgi:hypothetical protein